MSFSFLSRVRFTLWGAALALTLALSACSSSQSPEGTVESYFKAVDANRVEDAVKLFSLKNVKESDLTMAKGKLQMIVGEQYAKTKAAGGLESVKTKLVEQKENTAVVEAEILYKNGKTRKEKLTLTKESGGWKLLLK
ncbi:MAG: DUF4878 domain-containing protein [Candidatus Accumulibacter sp.]|jgi:hypothetical protein|nr:DUF4878 domain-containing protein [Accumulibacter sp.]